jgi:hypothetical protein
MRNQEDYQLAIDSINIVRTLIDSAIADGRANDAWILAGKHAMMVKAAADQQAPIVAERMKAEAAVARAAYLASPEQVMKGAAIEQERLNQQRLEDEAQEHAIRARAAREAAEKAAAARAQLDEKHKAKLLADEELQAQKLAAEIAERVAKELAAGQ